MSYSGSTKKIVRSREDIIHEDYSEWKIPNEKLENIYSIGTFDPVTKIFRMFKLRI